jgi:hypothetical protein
VLAFPFTPRQDAQVRKIRVAMAHFSGPNRVEVDLMDDAGGVPGRILRRYHVSDLPPFGACCETERDRSPPVPVSVGMQYWASPRPSKTRKPLGT